MSEKLVFVLGAGFTRAFVPSAPLLRDDFDIPRLRDVFGSFPTAKAILDDALADGPDRIDLERLMTRLNGVPYDSLDTRRELAVLETMLRKALVRRLNDAKAAQVDWDQLDGFARFVLAKQASIITFNYDDVFDEALWRVHQITSSFVPPGAEAHWHPDGGYGFFCRPSVSTVTDSPTFMDQPTTLMLKLHGSINWYSRLGEPTVRGPAALLHHENWSPKDVRRPYPSSTIESHLEADPFIVPPVLVKSELSAHPVLRVVWELAYRALSAATDVVFIGYSLPATDLASRTLFRETLRNRSAIIRVVNFASDDETDTKESIEASYRSLFGIVAIDFSGARTVIARDFSEVSGQPAAPTEPDRP